MGKRWNLTMARNFIQPADVISLIAPAAVKSGGVVHVGALIGVAAFDAAAGEEVEVALTGAFELPKVAGPLAQGALAFWDGSAVVAEEGEDDPLPLLGTVIVAAGASASTARIRLNGVST
jgi:predicted RecA/RadA family phage recombinase